MPAPDDKTPYKESLVSIPHFNVNEQQGTGQREETGERNSHKKRTSSSPTTPSIQAALQPIVPETVVSLEPQTTSYDTHEAHVTK